MTAVLDTCVFISGRIKPTTVSKHFVSMVVVHELIAGAADTSEAKDWATFGRQAYKVGRLLVPDIEDWIESGRVLNHLRHGMKSKQHSKRPKLSKEEAQRITRDVLIARTVKRAGSLLVTDNIRDFEMIQPYCNVRVKSSREFFG